MIRYIAIDPHLEPTVRGLVRTEDLTYFVLMTAFLLWLTRTAVEALRWR